MTPAPITAACTIFSVGVREAPFLYFSARKKLRIRFCVDSVLPSATIPSSSNRSASPGEIDKVLLIISQAPASQASTELRPPPCVFQRAAFRVRDREADRLARFHRPVQFSKLPERNKVCLSKSLPRPLQLRSIAAIACTRPRREEDRGSFLANRSGWPDHPMRRGNRTRAQLRNRRRPTRRGWRQP